MGDLWLPTTSGNGTRGREDGRPDLMSCALYAKSSPQRGGGVEVTRERHVSGTSSRSAWWRGDGENLGRRNMLSLVVGRAEP